MAIHQSQTCGARPAHLPGGTKVTHYGLLMLAVLLLSLIGISWRPLGQLSMMWPANAVVLGLFLRIPQLASPAGWIAAACGYLLADFLAGSTWAISITLNLINLLSVFIALVLCMHLNKTAQPLTSPGALPRLLLAVTTASIISGLASGLLSWQFFARPLWPSAPHWAVSELLSYIIVLPCVLSAPPLCAWRWRERRSGVSPGSPTKLIPMACLLAAFLATVFIGGPGALAFPTIALLACALTYGFFATSLLTLLFSMWTLLGTAFGNIPLILDINDSNALLSMRLGVASIAVTPIIVASVMAARKNSLAAMRHLAEHDALTGLLNRRTFYQRAKQQLHLSADTRKPAAVLMIDIDHFKQINDTYGHAFGDHVLSITAKQLRQLLRSEDLCGRVGGEEFSIMIPECTQALLENITQRIHHAIDNTDFQPDNSQSLKITLSIGATLGNPASEALEDMLLRADKALYAAKNGGRHQTRFL